MIGFTSCMCIEEVIVGDVRNGNQITYSFYIVISYMGWNVLYGKTTHYNMKKTGK